MEKSKYDICVICGGQSSEHEVSLASAYSVINNLNKQKYNIHLIAISKDEGEWRYYKDIQSYAIKESKNLYKLNSDNFEKITFTPGSDPFYPYKFDLIFPVIHGENCEDGTLQGLLELFKIPIVGCKTLSSALCFDKILSKIIAKEALIPVVPWLSFNKQQKIDTGQIKKEINYPLFVKPCCAGSSIGVTKVFNENDLIPAIDKALQISDLVLVEKAIKCREIECAVLGHWNSDISSSSLGEVNPAGEFYDYEAKYIDEKGAELIIPAKLDRETEEKLKETAEIIFRNLRCSGLARIDFFIDKDNNEFYFNEINTIPGFTTISMYPLLWADAGLEYSELLDKLIEIAIKDKYNG